MRCQFDRQPGFHREGQKTALLSARPVPVAGFPEERDDDVRQTIKFAKEIDADYYSLSVLAPYFGTKVYSDMIDAGFKLDKKPWEYFFHQTGDLMVNDHISQEVLEEYLALSSLNNAKKGYI